MIDWMRPPCCNIPMDGKPMTWPVDGSTQFRSLIQFVAPRSPLPAHDAPSTFGSIARSLRPSICQPCRLTISSPCSKSTSARPGSG